MESINYTQKGLISFQLNGEGMCYLKKTIFLLCTSLALVTCSSDKIDQSERLPEFTVSVFSFDYFILLRVDTYCKKIILRVWVKLPT